MIRHSSTGLRDLLGSKTLWQSVLGWTLVLAARSVGVEIPIEAGLAITGAVGLKESARRFRGN